jgi:hypothetical protein
MKHKKFYICIVFSLIFLLTELGIYCINAQSLCSKEISLEALSDCILSHAPDRGMNGYNGPDEEQLADWRMLVSEILKNGCRYTMIPESLKDIYTVFEFTDSASGGNYCVAMETRDANMDDIVDSGLGTFIANPSHEIEVIIEVPHPKDEYNTARQGVYVFKNSRARAFIMAGAHKDTNFVSSSCQPDKNNSDAAHNTENFLYAATEEIDSFYYNRGIFFTVIQFHGMKSSSCKGADVYITHGKPIDASINDSISELKFSLTEQHPEWQVVLPGETTRCNLHGEANVEGRFLNGVLKEDICYNSPFDYSGRFVYIEQKPNMRSSVFFETWTKAVKAAFGSIY